MSALPFLGNLRLSEPTGVPIILLKRDKSGNDGGEAKRLTSAKDAKGDDPTIGKAVDDFTTEAKARQRLDELLQKLSGDYLDTPEPERSKKVKESKEFVQKWRRAICVNMNAKRKLYDIEFRRLKDEIKKEHEKQLRIFDAAKRPLSEVGSDPKPHEGPRAGETALLDVKPSENKWEFIEKERWRELNSQAEDIQKLQNDIAKRIEKLRSADAWRQSVAHFVNTLKKLREYPQLSEMTEKIVDSVVAFINNSSISSNQFYNVMLMGAAGTGKTRLASIIATIFAQLGMYVHERLVEAQAGDFIGQYLGETAAKSRKFLARNIERVIFLDEAYALTHYDANSEGGDTSERKLDQYSDEAINVLIPYLSENVGQMAMIVAGYEDRIKKDFLPSNEGMGRRFPIRATLTSYKKEDLYKIFLKQAAVNFVGKRPAKEDEVVAYEGAVEVQRGALAALFTRDAEQLFYDVADAAERPESIEPKVTYTYPHLRKLFEAQAGAMTNMAGVASSLLLATGEELTGMVADRRAMFNIILTFIQSVFTGFDGKEKEADQARNELVKALRDKRWLQTKGGKAVWNAYPYVPCDSDEKNPNCAQLGTKFVADKFYTKDDIHLLDEEDYPCTLEPIWEQVVQAPTQKNLPKSQGGSSSSQSSTTEEALEQLDVALSPDVMKIVMPLLNKDGNLAKRYVDYETPAGYDDKVVVIRYNLTTFPRYELSDAEELAIAQRVTKAGKSGGQDLANAIEAASDRKAQIENDLLIQQRLYQQLIAKREVRRKLRDIELAKKKKQHLEELLASRKRQLEVVPEQEQAESESADTDTEMTDLRRSGRNR